ncbi:MAG: NAD-dependent epimerase/dehydratase family protein, partial [Treponemataceae bacterium]
MKRMLITGSGGFVAKHFIDYIQKNAIDINLLGIGLKDEIDIPIAYTQLDLADYTAVTQILKDFEPDYIVHLASVSSVAQSWNAPVASFLNNTNIFLNIVENVRILNLKTRILSVGSSEEYGNYPNEKMPLKEEYELKPNSPYSVARVSQEMLSKIYAKNYNIDIVMSRSFNHIGPGQKDIFVVSSFIRQLVEISFGKREPCLFVGNIEVIRDFLDVRDVVTAYYTLLTSAKKGSIYNVCSGTGVPLLK